MKELILKQEIFKITAGKEMRTISISNNMADIEYEKVLFEPGHLNLKTKTGGLLKFSRVGDHLEAKDYRTNGVVELHPTSDKKQQFVEYFQNPRKIGPLDASHSVKLPIDKHYNTAIITNGRFGKYDVYLPLMPLHKMYAELFEAGYEYVIYLENDLHASYADLLINIQNSTNCHFSQGTHFSNVENPKADQLHVEKGDWTNFLVPKTTWEKVQNDVISGQGNTKKRLQESLIKYDLIRLCASMSRLTDRTPQDSVRKNFTIRNNNG